jgi:flagellar FliL protein
MADKKNPKEKDAEEEEEKEKKEEGESGEEGQEGGEGKPAKPGLTKKKKLIFGAAAAVVLLGAVGGGLYFTGIIGHKGVQTSKEAAPKLPQVVYYEFQPITVNLNTGGRQTKYLKLKFTLELPGESDKAAVQSRLPKIVDTLNTYLRELRSSDLVGSAGVYRLKEELQLRINKIIYPSKVNEVLIEEMQDQ